MDYRVKNWYEYDQSLRDRGDITLWISHDAIDAWRAPMTGKRGAQPVYSDLAIETALALRLLFHLPLRQTEGFLHSVLRFCQVVEGETLMRRTGPPPQSYLPFRQPDLSLLSRPNSRIDSASPHGTPTRTANAVAVGSAGQ
jgi:hypothetical protein